MQTNVQEGLIVLTAGEDLTDKEQYLVKIANDSGSPVALLPEANDDYALYIVSSDGDIDENVDLIPLESGKNYRVVLKDTCNPGTVLVLADVATPADKGKLRALPAAPGTYKGIGIAEEAGVDGQEVKFRHFGIGNITVS